MTSNLKKINIIGMGVVGQALFNNLYSFNLEKAECYDLDNQFPTFTEHTRFEGDVTFICVNTPREINGSQDATVLQNILQILVKKGYSGLVVVKSTVLYKNIEPYINELNLVVCPEFLSAGNSSEDFRTSKYLVFGGKLGKAAYEIHKDLFEFETCPQPIYCTIKEAIDFKYTRNLQQAYNVLFWEGIQSLSGNALKMAQMMEKMPVSENSNISQGGYRGYGQSMYPNEPDFSACLDKDARAMLKHYGEHPLLKYIVDFNEGLM